MGIASLKKPLTLPGRSSFLVGIYFYATPTRRHFLPKTHVLGHDFVAAALQFGQGRELY
jgi:hypothetical protein